MEADLDVAVAGSFEEPGLLVVEFLAGHVEMADRVGWIVSVLMRLEVELVKTGAVLGEVDSLDSEVVAVQDGQDAVETDPDDVVDQDVACEVGTGVADQVLVMETVN